MAIEHGIARACGLERKVEYNTETRRSKRWSKSAKAWVNNGKHDSLDDAISEAENDIERGQRERGDTSYRGS